MNRISLGLAALLLGLLQGCGDGPRDAAPAAATARGDEAAHDGHGHDPHGHGGSAAGHDEHGHDEHGGDAHGHGEQGHGETAEAGGHGGEEEEDEHGHGHGHGHEEGEPDFAAIGPEQAAAAGVIVSTAETGLVDAGLLLSGTLVIDPQRMARVRARFPGLVRAMRKEVGDAVAKGEALASIESNESLTVYTVASPIGGVVLERHVNTGDVGGEGPLYTIGDTGALQAELRVFPSSVSLVRPGAAATLLIGPSEVAGTISAILPELDARTQARRVRVVLDGMPPAGLAAGQFVSARIAAETPPGTVVIPLAAVKRLAGRDVVFVPGESRGRSGFRARPVTLGEHGRLRVAVRSGLAAGERYVSEGAFLLKAEIGKNQAAHEH
jgi:membrane fusion protein, heavy metal efflux system